MEQEFFFYLALVPVLGITAQLIAWWTKLPSILLLLGFGVALGLWQNPQELLDSLANSEESFGTKILFPAVSLAVATVLFEGGLSLRLRELTSSGQAVLRLVTLGALISWVLTALAAKLILGLETRIAILLGSILVVTGPTVVAPLMRFIRPKKNIGSIVKWEGIVIDPIGALLAVLVFESLFNDLGHAPEPFTVISMLLLTAVVGTGLGLLGAFCLVQLVKRYWIPDYLHSVAFLSAGLGLFALSNGIQEESGLVTVTVLGIALANQRSVSIDHVVAFKENLGVFLISCLFIVLGSWLEPNDLIDLGWEGIIFVLVMIASVRPVSVLLSTIGTKTTKEERIFLSFLAPRGIVAAAVTSIFALKIISHGPTESWTPLIQDAQKLVPITFLVIVGTVTIYGLGAAPLARYLGLADISQQGVLFAGADPWIREIAAAVKAQGVAVSMVDTNYRNVAESNMAGIKAYCASILSDFVHEDADLAGIGRLFAMTPNDAINAMATSEYAHIFGRKNVYQLAHNDTASGQRKIVGTHKHGRVLFGPTLNHAKLSQLFANGFKLKTTSLTTEFGIDEFLTNHGDKTIILMSIDAAGKLQIATKEVPLKPEAGEKIIAIVPPAEPK
jgi:NhaP-type Na+/H+ or K+/H+ antiporter